MKKLFMILVAFLCGTIVRAQPDPIIVNDVTIAKGGTKQMEVTINYAGNMTAFQFDLTLPTGFSVKDVNLNGEYGNTRHLLEGTVAAGKMRFLSYDDVNGKLTDDTKVIITLEATEGAETATMRGDGILLVEPDGSCIFQEFTSAMITIQNGAKTRMHSVGRNTFSSEVNTMLNQFATNSLTRQSDFWKGDINVDGILDGRDITALADSIIGDKQSSHLDINEDQKVNVSDLVTLVNLIAEVSPSPTPTPTPSPTPVDPTPVNPDPTPVNPTPSTTFYQGGIYYQIGENNTVSVISGEVKYIGDVVIPEQVTYNGKTYSVTSISWSAFEGCSGLTSVTIPNSVMSIGWEAFYDCSGLTSVTIPNGCWIGKDAFGGFSGLTSITLSGRVSCDDRAFSGCANLNAVHILDLEAFLHSTFELEDGPSNPFFYAHHLYLNGEEIKVLVIPNTITQINDCVFMGCSDLTSITIPNSVISIGRLAFYGCSGLTSVFIPNSVTSIGSSAFADCSGLTSVTIPNSVTSISDHAFYNCSGLTTITLEIEKPFEIFSGTFSDDTYNVAELIVPYGTKAAYQATEGWNKFTMITEAQDRDVVTFTIDAITYEGSKSEKTVVVKAVDAKLTNIKIPVSVNYDGITYQVSGIIDGIFDGSNMAALIWDVEASLPNNAFSNASIGSNFLLYVKSSSYAPSSVKNVVVDGTAQTIVLSDDGGQFYCPQAFTARRISYSHNYSMETGKGSTMGWESIALPFDVQRIIHSTQGEIVPFADYISGSNLKPFWLAYMSAGGFKRTADIRANEAYIIAMPNNSSYQDNYILAGDVTFSAENITVPQTPTFNGTLLPAFSFIAKSSSVYALNVNNRYVRYSGSEKPGSVFIRDLRDVRPFEAYLTGNFTRGIIEINYDNDTTDLLDVLLSTDDSKEMTIHTLSGQQVSRTTQRDFDTVWQPLPNGVYIVNGKKMIK